MSPETITKNFLIRNKHGGMISRKKKSHRRVKRALVLASGQDEERLDREQTKQRLRRGHKYSTSDLRT